MTRALLASTDYLSSTSVSACTVPYWEGMASTVQFCTRSDGTAVVTVTTGVPGNTVRAKLVVLVPGTGTRECADPLKKVMRHQQMMTWQRKLFNLRVLSYEEYVTLEI
jgi:hypothetical protein